MIFLDFIFICVQIYSFRALISVRGECLYKKDQAIC